MRVAILESIIMPAGHEVEFDRILINELKRQGHEPVLFVPENFPFKVDYGVDIVYLEGGEVVTYAGASKWKKPFLSILRERRRRSWFTSAAEKIKEHNIDALIIPTGTYRYIKALLDTPLKDSQAAVHVIFHGIGKGEMDRFIKQAHRAKNYKNVYLNVISLRDDMLRPDLPRVRKILPPVFLPSSELSGEQQNIAVQSAISEQGLESVNSSEFKTTNDAANQSVNKPIKLGFFGQFRKEKNIERFIDAFVSLNYDDSVQLVVQGATVKPEDGELFESIIKQYSKYSNIQFIHASLIGKDWDRALLSVDALLLPYGAERYRYHWAAMLFTAIGFQKPVLISPEINPEVLEQYSIGEVLNLDSVNSIGQGIQRFVENLKHNKEQYNQGLIHANEDYSHRALIQSIVNV
ncbi:MAG: glycosyltransferase [Veillonella sp.]|jgi:putative glycosyl transferase, group 1 family|uniref:glycosyltransferase n=1 Tax=Veillonella sp. TaxID=1926307 RepID=UPI00290935F3|nr:glycosyltransferase [Veillonella sp.]MDU4713112.1 glycosyltransferase [Veillonella sp.]